MMTRMQSSSSSPHQFQNPRRVSFEDTDRPSSKRRFVGLTGGSQRRRGAATATSTLSTKSSSTSHTTTVFHPSSASIPLYHTPTGTTGSSISHTTNPSHLSSPTSSISSILRKKSVTVLHGRVFMKEQPSTPPNEPKTFLHEVPVVTPNCSSKQRRSFTNQTSGMSIERMTPSYSYRSSAAGGTSIRDLLERKAMYTQLLEETRQFQQQVTTLENVLKRDYKHLPAKTANDFPLTSTTSTVSAESGWRIRLLLTKAQETDSLLWKKIYEYEKTLHNVHNNSGNNSQTTSNEIRDLQTSCIKLHRDFQRCHKGLLMCLSLLDGDDDTNRSMNHQHDCYDMSMDDANPTTVTTTPIVEAVGWTSMMNNQPIRNTIRDSSDSHDDFEDDSLLLSQRSMSPIPVYTSFRKETKHGIVKPKTIIDDDEYDDDDDHRDQDHFFEAFTKYCFDENKFCGGRRGGNGTTSRREVSSEEDDEDNDPHSFWICGDVLDLRHNVHHIISTTPTTPISSSTVPTNPTNDRRRVQNHNDQHQDTIGNDGNDTTESYNSSRKYYEKWYQQIQKNIHSMQLDLLHFRSRSSNRHFRNEDDMNYDDDDDGDDGVMNEMDVVPEYISRQHGLTRRNHGTDVMNHSRA